MINHRKPMRRSYRRQARYLLTTLGVILLTVALLASGGARADTSQATPTALEPAAEPPAADAAADDAEPTATATNPVDSTAEPVPAATLTYAPAERPICQPDGGQTETVAHGGALDYVCVFSARVTGAHVAPTAVQLDWSVSAESGDGWSVQLLPPVSPAIPEPAWTDERSPRASFTIRAALAAGADDAARAFELAPEIRFLVRVHRDACVTHAAPVSLHVAVEAALSGADGAEIALVGRQPDAYLLAPALTPIPEPTLSFTSGLDFGRVPVDAYGARREPEPGSLTLTVTGLDQTCGRWEARLRARSGSENADSAIAAASLMLSSINGEPLADGGCALVDGCRIAIAAAGADAAPALSFQLGVALVLPNQLHPETFTATLVATLTAVDD